MPHWHINDNATNNTLSFLMMAAFLYGMALLSVSAVK
jgi:hypothetical protein